jgi:hypothetical protein
MFPLRRSHLLVALALAFAGHASAEEVPRFTIERITFAGASGRAAEILAAESRLREGGTYTEADLRDAVSRIDRLPFVVHSDFRLEKGSERGLYVLAVTIVETLPVFVSFHSLQHWVDTIRVAAIHPSAPDEPPHIEYRNTVEHGAEDRGTVGGRWFLGARGVVHAAVDYSSCGGCPSRFPRLSAGYTRYGLLGSNATLSIVTQYRNTPFALPASFTGDTGVSFPDRLAYEVTLAVPLFRNEAVRAQVYRQKDPFAYPVKDGTGTVVRVERFDYDTVSLAWLHDTTDDPLFPTRGTSLRVSAESRDRIRLRDGRPARERDRDWSAAATRHWDLSNVHSVFAAAELQTLNDRAFRETRAGAGYVATLANGDLRFETRAEVVLAEYGSATAYGRARAGLALRGRWGIVGLAAEYIGWRDRAE